MDESNESKPNLIAELDRRQNEVLTRLDELNQSIEEVLQGWQSEDDRCLAEEVKDAA